jgi:hypothetical protein
MTNLEKEITFENTIFEGNEINIDGKRCKVDLVKHQCPNRDDGGDYRCLFQPLDGSLEIQKFVSYNDSRDWYVLYQNGKK